MPSREWHCGTYLVGLNSGNFLVGLDCVANLLLPSLERTFRDGLGHLRHLDGLICSQRNRTSVTASRHCPREVKNSVPFSSFVVWKGARRARSLQRAPSQRIAQCHACISEVEGCGNIYNDTEWTRPGTHQLRDVARTPTVLRGIMPRARARATTRFDNMAERRPEVDGR